MFGYDMSMWNLASLPSTPPTPSPSSSRASTPKTLGALPGKAKEHSPWQITIEPDTVGETNSQGDAAGSPKSVTSTFSSVLSDSPGNGDHVLEVGSLQEFLGNVDTSLPPPALPERRVNCWNERPVLNGGSGGLDKEFDRLLTRGNHGVFSLFGPGGDDASKPPSPVQPVGSEYARTRTTRFTPAAYTPGVDFSRADFDKNGTDAEIDEMDKLRMRSATKVKVQDRKPRRLPTMEELAHLDCNDPMIQKTLLLRTINDAYATNNQTMLPRVLPLVNQIKKDNKLCRFCWKNGETEIVYKSHNLKDKGNNVTCPILYIYECPTCGASGINAHTKKYCPNNNNDEVSMPALRTGRNSTGRRRPIMGSSTYTYPPQQTQLPNFVANPVAASCVWQQMQNQVQPTAFRNPAMRMAPTQYTTAPTRYTTPQYNHNTNNQWNPVGRRALPVAPTPVLAPVLTPAPAPVPTSAAASMEELMSNLQLVGKSVEELLASTSPVELTGPKPSPR